MNLSLFKAAGFELSNLILHFFKFKLISGMLTDLTYVRSLAIIFDYVKSFKYAISAGKSGSYTVNTLL